MNRYLFTFFSKNIVLLLSLFMQELAVAQVEQKFQMAKKDSVHCITREKLFEYLPLDTLFQLVKKPALQNFISAIRACGYNYKYSGSFNDKACKFRLPKWFTGYSLGFGDNYFFISFEDEDTASGNCIVLHYNLQNEYPLIFYTNIGLQNWQNDRLSGPGKTLYHFKNIQGILTGEILLGDKMSIAYYTREPKTEQLLRECIFSCRLE